MKQELIGASVLIVMILVVMGLSLRHSNAVERAYDAQWNDISNTEQR